MLATLNGMHLLLIGNWAPSLFRIGGIDCYSPPSVPSCSPFSAFVFTLQCLRVHPSVPSCSPFSAFVFTLQCLRVHPSVPSCSPFSAFVFTLQCLRVHPSVPSCSPFSALHPSVSLGWVEATIQCLCCHLLA